mgnify:FL=1
MTTRYELRGNDVIKIITTEEKLDLKKLSQEEVWEIMKELIRKSNQTQLTFPYTNPNWIISPKIPMWWIQAFY